GTKVVSVQSVVERLVKHKTFNNLDNENLLKMFNRQEARKKVPSKSGIRVPGVDTMKITLAACCSPVPGDDIVGYIQTGQGVKVHRKDCPNITKEKTHLINVEWDDELEEKSYEVQLILNSNDRNFLLSDIVMIVSQCKAGLNHVDSKVNEDKLTATTKMAVVVKDAQHLKTLIANLRKIDSVIDVSRIIL
ncbi:MAG: ACT domain-containing protein, partial [Erysipelotrichaceae bacterium]